MRPSGEVSSRLGSGSSLGVPAPFARWAGVVFSVADRRLEEARRAGVAERRLRGISILAFAGPPAAFVLGLVISGVAAGVLGAVGAVVWADLAARRAIEGERTRFRRSFPDAVDLLAIACMAGMNPYRAFRAVGAARPSGCEGIFDAIAAALSSGATVSDALRRLSQRVRSPELAALSRAISGAERLGHPLGPALMRLAADLREREIRSAQAAARKAPVKALFPLVFCILPAFVLLTVVPVLADTFAVIRQ